MKGKEMDYEVRAVRDRYGMGEMPRAIIHARQCPSDEAKFMMAIIERWAMVAATPDGEDSAGRAKLGHLPIEDMVVRAADVAERAFKEVESRGWFIQIPSLDQCEEDIKEREDKRENK